MTTEFEERYGIQDPEDTRWLWTAPPVMSYSHREFTAVIVRSEAEPMWHLAWTDHVANDWVEHYDILAIAVLRLGALIDAVNLSQMFTQAAEGEFAQRATEFLQGSSS